jgi:hypothetical protein
MTRILLVLLIAVAGCMPVIPPAQPAPTPPPAEVGVLVMAHGGSPEWNATVADAVAPLDAEIPTVVAYGMADPVTMASALDSLRSVGVDRVAVVRLFLSGQSFLKRTEYFLGLSDNADASFVAPGPDAPPAPIDHGLSIATHQRGLMTSAEARQIAVERALAQSRERRSETVLLLAHGMGDEEENDRVLNAMALIATDLRQEGFAAVEVATLREDWGEKRVVAEAAIREFVAGQTDEGRRVLVVPIRLSGFGPYAKVLAGLDYTPAPGLLPHARVGDWIRQTASTVFCEKGWQSTMPC